MYSVTHVPRKTLLSPKSEVGNPSAKLLAKCPRTRSELVRDPIYFEGFKQF